MKDWIAAFRLRTLPLAFSCIITGSALAFSEDNFNSIVFVLCIITTLFLQVLSNLANDYGDAEKGTDNNDRVGPERAIQSGKISAKQMKTAIVIFSILSLVSGIPLIIIGTKAVPVVYFIGFLILGILAIIAAIKYTAGKSAYGYRGLGDIFVFLFFGLAGVLGTLFLHQKSILCIAILPAITVGLFSVGVLNLNNMRDHVNDKAFGKMTIPVKIGIKTAKFYHLSLILLGFISTICYSIYNDSGLVNYIYLLSFIPLALHLKRVSKNNNEKDFDPELKVLALSTFLFSVLFFISLAL